MPMRRTAALLRPPRKRRDPVERGRIAPVKVLQAERNRPARAHGLERVGQLPKHPIASHPDAASLQRREFRAACWNAGSCASHVGAQRRSRAMKCSPSCCRQSRVSASSSGWYASPAPYCSTQSARAMRHPFWSPMRERKASTSAVFPIPGSPVRKTICLVPVWASADAWANCASAASRPTIDPAGRAGGGVDRAIAVDVTVCGAGHQKPEAAPVNRLDEPRLARIVLERLSQLLDAGGEGSVADGGVRPDRSKQLLLGDDLLGSLDERAEHRERLRRDADFLSASLQPLRRVQAIAAEANRSTCGHRHVLHLESCRNPMALL